MLEWTLMENGKGWIGWEDDCPRYFVKQDEDGWYWEDSWGFGVGGYDTADEAKAEAEKDLPVPSYEEEGFTAEELEEIYYDDLAHERMEKEKGGGLTSPPIQGGIKMKYNTEKNISEIKMRLRFIASDAQEVLEKISLQADNDALDHMWRLCELIGEMAQDARVLIGKMSDEREELEGA